MRFKTASFEEPFPAAAVGAPVAVSAAVVVWHSMEGENPKVTAKTSKRSPAQHPFMHLFFMILFCLLSQSMCSAQWHKHESDPSRSAMLGPVKTETKKG